MKELGRVHTVIILVILGIGLYICSFFWVVPLFHDATLKNFSEPLLSISVPENTRQIGSISVVGQQFTAGDHCDYLAGVLINSSLTKESIQKYYKDHYVGKSEVRFVWLDEENPYTKEMFDPQTIFSLKDWIKDHSNASPTAAVYIFEGHMTSSFDYRCS